MSKTSMIHVELEFSGALLPVETNEQGQHIIPLKPISDVIGLEWEYQRKKVSESYLSKRLGTCTVVFYCAGQKREMVGIRLDRVEAYLNTLNPEMVRGHGNQAAADFLEAKHEEWDNLIDAYERGYGILAKNGKGVGRKQPAVRDFLSVLRAKKQADVEQDRKVLELLARQIAEDLGTPYQGDFLDGAEVRAS